MPVSSRFLDLPRFFLPRLDETASYACFICIAKAAFSITPSPPPPPRPQCPARNVHARQNKFKNIKNIAIQLSYCKFSENLDRKAISLRIAKYKQIKLGLKVLDILLKIAEVKEYFWSQFRRQLEANIILGYFVVITHWQIGMFFNN